MSSTYITLIQDHCAKWGLPILSGIVGSTEGTARQLLALTQETVEDLQVYKWQRQNIRITWNSLTTEDQGLLTTIFPGYRTLVPKTMWDLTLRRPIPGPMSEIQWQSLKGAQVSGPLNQFRVAEDKLFIYPAIGAVHSLSAIYTSRYGVISASSVAKERVTADDDTFVYPDNVFKAELEWRWLKQKEQAWAAAKDRAERLISMAIAKDNSLPELNMEPGTAIFQPGIFIPSGNWNV